MFTGKGWYDILLYFGSEGRHCVYIKVGGAALPISVEARNLGAGRPPWRGSSGALEACIDASQCGLQRRGDATRDSPGVRARKTLKRCGGLSAGSIKEIEAILLNHPCCPMNNIVNCEEWTNHPHLRLCRADNPMVKDCIDALKADVCRYSFSDLWEIYNRPSCKPTFHAGYMTVDSVYLTVAESLEVVDRLLLFQNNNDPLLVTQFLSDVYNVCERVIPKLNTILVHSPPSAGKNFFFDMILDYYWNRGQLGNPTRHNQFAYMECVGKRILLWNEPNYEDGQTDMLKMILGGDNYTVRVKSKEDCSVSRTPVIILTNNTIPLMYDYAFDDRIRKFSWAAAPFLKNVQKKPTPLCLYNLFVRYNIIPNLDTDANLE